MGFNLYVPVMKQKSLALLAIVFAAPIAAFAIALPGPTSCLLVSSYGRHEAPVSEFAGDSSTVTTAPSQHLVNEARNRIEATFGKPAAKPIVVFLDGSDRIGPFRLNAYGSTQFVAGRTCVVIGSKGRSVDVVAHELMHAELHHRVGLIKYFLTVPTWFDKGVAMQVDYRSRYSFAAHEAVGSDRVRELTTGSKFFVGDDNALTRNYSSAKYEVSKWLSEVGSTSLYSHLERIRAGASFEAALVR